MLFRGMGRANARADRLAARFWLRVSRHRVVLSALLGVASSIAVFAVGAAAADSASSSIRSLQRGSIGATYVALGDSYSAGEGLPPFEKGTDVDKGEGRNQCHRSRTGAYSVLSPAKVLPKVTSRAFFACSGATSRDMQSIPPQTGRDRQVGQPQQTATVGEKTRYITLSAGGNDVGFGDLGSSCVEAVVGAAAVVRVPGTSCKAQVAASKKQLAATRKSLISLYTDLVSRAPRATVVVLGYPRVFPASYPKVPKLPLLRGHPFCVLNHYPLKVSIDIGMPVAQAKMLDAFTVRLNATVKDAINAVRRARPAQQSQLRYADSYASSVPRNCRGTTSNATVNALRLSPLRGLSGPRLIDKLKLFISTATLHPTKVGQKLFAELVQRAFSTLPRPLTTVTTRQRPVTDQAAVAPGFTVTDSSPTGHCGEGSDIGVQAYRCFVGNRVLDPCYAIAEPETGDGTGVVCPILPFGNDLYAIDSATGLGTLDPTPFDEPNGIVLGNGKRCTESQGAHSTDRHGRAVDYQCNDNKTGVLRGLHKKGRLWIADVARMTSDRYVGSGTQPIASAIFVQHQVPPANRPVTDAGDATADEFDSVVRRHHEVDCGFDDSSPVKQIFVSGVPCYEASLIVTEWDTGNELEPGWSCAYDDAETLLCQKSESVDVSNPPAFFSSAHIRAIAVG
jgi:GDSL-like lipase/acylhydrolase family protein